MRGARSSDDDFEAARNGSAPALRALYQRYAPAVVGYLRSRGAREPEDLTSEVFLGVLPRLSTFRGDEAAFRSFVFTVAHARLVDDLRRRSRAPDPVPWTSEEDPRTAPSAEEGALESVGTQRVLALLDQLVPDQRDVLLLRVVADLTVDQVADVLGKSSGAVKQLQRRGLLAVRRLVEAEGVTLDDPPTMTGT